MRYTKNNKAFTLVELIVVIVILAILATIAFLSFSSQSGSARDSTRLSDISSIKKSVEMYNVNAGTYPTPDYAYSYTYSGGIIWNQGTIGDSAYKMLQKNLSKKVVDPLKGSEYDYSLASNKREYQVAGNFENPTSLERNYNPFDSSNLSPQLSALGGTGANVYISGNYNGVMLKVFTGSTYYFVPTPTLFGIGTGSTVYDNTFGSGKDLLPGVNNAAVFDSSKVYASTSSTGLSAAEVESLMVTIQSAYLTGNVNTPAVQEVLAATGSALTDLGVGLVKNSLGGGTSTVSPDNTLNCPTGNVYSGSVSKCVPDAGTVLLMHFDDNITDSAKGKTGSPSNITYGTGVFGKAAYFNGSSSSINIPDSTDWDFGTGSFTMEFWYKAEVNRDSQGIFCQQTAAIAGAPDYNRPFCVLFNNNSLYGGSFNDGAYSFSYSTGAILNQWKHLAVVRNLNTFSMYLDGKLIKQDTNAISLATSLVDVSIGKIYYNYNNYYFQGYIDELRISKGIARWTSEFTPPAVPY